MADGSTGYLHSLDGEWKAPEPVRKSERKVDLSIPVLMERYQRNATPPAIEEHAEELGVHPASLRLLGIGRRDTNTWAFPMRDSRNYVVGIRLRTNCGKKFAETGSHQGLFLPQMDAAHTAFLPEGPTDTAAALTLGLYAIGRPSSNGGIFELVEAIKRRPIKQVVIIADNDEDKERPDGSHYNPGFDGAVKLMEHMPVRSCILALPAKDVRKFLIAGGTSELVEALLTQVIWTNPCLA